MADRSSATEKPTPRKLREARREGRIAKSQELTTWTGLLAASYVMGPTVSRAGRLGIDLVNRGTDLIAHPDATAATALLRRGLTGVVPVLLLPCLVLVLAAVGTAAAQGAARPAPKLLKPKWSRLNPGPNLKRMVGGSGLWEGAKSLLKVVVLGLVLWRGISALLPVLHATGENTLSTVLSAGWAQLLWLMRATAGAGLVLALADYAINRKRLRKQLRMTRQEVKDEMRQAEGDPLVRSAIRSRQLAISRNRMMAAVSTAEVVLVNPTHLAVALHYAQGQGAPTVVAKGAGKLAARIRAEAGKHGVPVIHDVPLARAVYHACDIGQQIPATLYAAVARVLAFVFSLRTQKARPATDRSAARRHDAAHGRVDRQESRVR